MKHPAQHHTVPASEVGRQPRLQLSALCLDDQNLLSLTQLGKNCKGDTASSKPRCHTTQHANTMCIDNEASTVRYLIEMPCRRPNVRGSRFPTKLGASLLGNFWLSGLQESMVLEGITREIIFIWSDLQYFHTAKWSQKCSEHLPGHTASESYNSSGKSQPRFQREHFPSPLNSLQITQWCIFIRVIIKMLFY